MNKLIILAICMVVAASAAEAGGATDAGSEFHEIEESVYASPTTTVRVEAVSGNLTVRGWTQPNVHVSGRAGPDVSSVEISRNEAGKEISVVVHIAEGARTTSGRVESYLDILVPYGAQVGVHTLSSDVRIQDVRTAVDVRTVTGNVTISGPVQTALVEAMAGDITVSGPVGIVDFATLSGNVSLANAQQAVVGGTWSGNIRVSGSDLRAVDVHTFSGDVDLDVSVATDGTIQARLNYGGLVRITLPATVEGLFTFVGGPVSSQVDLEGFHPHAPVEWSIGSPLADEQVGAVPGTGEEQRPPGIARLPEVLIPSDLPDGRTHIPRYRYGLTTTREFRVGDGTLRVIIESSGGPWDEEKYGSAQEPRIVLKTVE